MRAFDLRTGLLAVAALAAAPLFGCGGGASSGSSLITSSGGSKQIAASFTIRIPAKTQSASRSLQFVSPSTQSVTVIAIYGDTTPVIPAVVDTTPTSTDCVLQSDGSRLCTVVVEIIRGATGLNITAYDQPEGQGQVLARTTVAIPQTNGDIVNVAITLGGVVSRFSLALAGGAFTPGIGGAKIVTLSAFDYDGDLIVAPGDYDSPIQLNSSDPSVTVFPNVVSNPAQTITAVYDGTMNSSASITAYLSSNTLGVQAVRAVGSGPATPGPPPSGTPNPVATTIIVVR
jgi:hypothetical protein